MLKKFRTTRYEGRSFFGSSVAMWGDLAVITAPGISDQVESQGAAYLFDMSTQVQLDTISPSQPELNGNFGLSAAIYGNKVLLGSENHINQNNVPVGLAHSFLVADSCTADLNGDRILNFFDISTFINLYTNQDQIADLNGDGEFNFFDVSAFLSAYNAGCP